jgi:hypothetical protein
MKVVKLLGLPGPWGESNRRPNRFATGLQQVCNRQARNTRRTSCNAAHFDVTFGRGRSCCWLRDRSRHPQTRAGHVLRTKSATSHASASCCIGVSVAPICAAVPTGSETSCTDITCIACIIAAIHTPCTSALVQLDIGQAVLCGLLSEGAFEVV